MLMILLLSTLLIDEVSLQNESDLDIVTVPLVVPVVATDFAIAIISAQQYGNIAPTPASNIAPSPPPNRGSPIIAENIGPTAAFTTLEKPTICDSKSPKEDDAVDGSQSPPEEDPTALNNKDPSDKEKIMLYTLTAVNLLLAVLSIILNCTVIAYYWKSTDNIFSTLYLRNGVADLGFGLGILIHTPILLLTLNESTLSQARLVFLLVGYLLTTLLVRLSVFLNCAISVSRCINIVSPFYNIHKASVKIYITASTLFFAAFWGAAASYDIYRFVKMKIEGMYLVKMTALKPATGWSVLSVIADEDIGNGLNALILFLVPFGFPALLCLSLMFLQIYHLLKSSKKSGGSSNRKPAVTIFIVSSIYVVTNVVSVACWFIVYHDYLGIGSDFKALSWVELSVIYFATATCPLLCSTFTPLALILRGKKFKKTVFDTVTMSLRLSVADNARRSE